MYILGPKRNRDPLTRLFNELDRELGKGVNLIRELGVPLLSDPGANLVEREGEYELQIAVPGLKKNDLDVSIKGRRLTVSSDSTEEDEEKTEKYHYREWNHEKFSRTFSLPRDASVEGIEARCEDGVLSLIFSRKDEEGDSLTVTVE